MRESGRSLPIRWNWAYYLEEKIKGLSTFIQTNGQFYWLFIFERPSTSLTVYFDYRPLWTRLIVQGQLQPKLSLIEYHLSTLFIVLTNILVTVKVFWWLVDSQVPSLVFTTSQLPRNVMTSSQTRMVLKNWNGLFSRVSHHQMPM